MTSLKRLSAALLLMLLALFACKRAMENAQEKMIENAIEESTGGDAKVDLDEDGDIYIESDEGSFKMSSDDKEWPGEIPSFVPEPQEGTIMRVMRSEANGAQNWTVFYKGLPMDMMDGFRDALKAEGLKTSIMKSNQGGMVTGHNDTYNVTLSIGPDEGVINFTKKQ